jgi:streptogramin lyase
MMRLGMVLPTALVTSIAGGTVHAKMVMQTFPVLAGAGAHDVYPAPDGAVWFTAQSAGKLGRLDPKTGMMAVFDAPRGTGPYGIASTPDGQVFFASLAGSYLGSRHRTGAGFTLSGHTKNIMRHEASSRRKSVAGGIHPERGGNRRPTDNRR